MASTSPKAEKSSPPPQVQASPQAEGSSPPTQVQTSAPPLQGGSGGGNIEVDSDSYSDYSSEGSSATTSVASSVFSFTYANGRRYHSDRFKTQYFLPNDEVEQERLDLYHHIFLLLLGGKLYIAPLDNPQKVLDVGTGTGIWAIDFADENPQAAITGVDISPIQPSWIPQNCKFEVDDMEEPWTYDADYFDYIHIRSLSGSFRDWGKVLKEAYRATAPGGYVEFQDYSCQPFLCDGTRLVGVNKEHPVSTYIYYLKEACHQRGIILDVAPHAEKYLADAGFVDIVVQTAIWPVGHWPRDKRLKEIGRYGRVGSEDGLYPFGISLLTTIGWTPEQVIELCDSVKESYKNMDKKNSSLVGKYYFQAWFVYGRKPEKDEEC